MNDAKFQDIISELPFPVAFRIRYILTRSDTRSRIEGILDAYESILKFLSLVMISDYLRGNIEDQSIEKRLKKLFTSKISSGQWVEILREILRCFSTQRDHSFMPELVSLFWKGKKLSTGGQQFDIWCQRRNDFRGHAKHLITDAFIQDTWAQWWPEFKEFVSQMSFLSHYELIIPVKINRNTVIHAQICTGPEQFFLFSEKYNLPLNVKGVEPDESLLLIDKSEKQRQLLLYPFMVARAPADFYLFEKCERSKGNLQNIVFASLGPGGVLKIKRTGEHSRIIDDLELRLEKVGDIGLVINEAVMGISDPGKNNQGEFEDLSHDALIWSDSGYPYHMLENIEKSVVAKIRHPSESMKMPDKNKSVFIAVASLHHGGNWCYWIQNIEDQLIAIDAIIKILKVGYSRPRYRSLYALQFFDTEALKEKIIRAQLYPDIIKLIETYVYTHTVIDYLKKLKTKLDGKDAEKVRNVLNEIKQYCLSDGEAEYQSGLPII